MSEVLFGGRAPTSGPDRTPVLEDADLVEEHDSSAAPEVDMVELVELAEAADADLATYMLGGDAPADTDHDAATLAAFLFGGADAEHQPEKTLQELVEERESLPVADLVHLLDRAEIQDALYMLGGDARTAAAAAAPRARATPEEGWVALVDRVDAADTALARFHLGGDAAKGADSQDAVAVAGPSMAGEEHDVTIAYLYDGHAAGAVATVARDILGGAGPAADADADAVRYLYGGDDGRVDEEQQEQHFTTSGTTSGTTSDEELIAHVLGGDAPAWGEEEATILYMLGETAAQPAQAPTGSRSRSRSRSDALERWAEGFAPAPYTGDEAEDCSDHECISRALRAMQAELGLGGGDSNDAGVIWGEDMVEYCQWQAEGEDDETDANAKESCNEQTSSNCPTSRRMPPLPSSYSVLRPPSLATCRQVLKPPAQMLKSS
jgi:hypothetical protein